MKKFAKYLLLTLISLISYQSCFAATLNWLGLTTSWNTATNWSTGAVPTSADNVQIGVIAFGASQPTITASASCSSLTIGNIAAVTLTINAPLAVTGAITVTSGTINSIVAGTISAASVSLSGATLTLNGTLTLSGALQTPTSPGGNSTLTTNAAGNTIPSGVAVHTGSNLTWNGSGTTTCGNSTIYSTTTLTIGSGNKITFSAGLGINASSTTGFLINSGTLTFSSSSLSAATPSTASTAITNNSGGNIALSGASISLSSLASMSNSGTITANSSSSLSLGNTSNYTSTSTGVLTLTGAPLSMSSSATINNSGTINFNSGASISTVNPSTITNTSTGTIAVSASTITISGGTTVNNSGLISFIGASTFNTNNPVTLTNAAGSTLSFTGATVNFNGGTTISNSGTISAGAGTTITASNPVPITNTSTGVITLSASTLNMQPGVNITNSGSVSALSASTITLGNASFINNNTASSSLTLTASTLNISAGGYITNSGTFTTSASSTILLNGNPATITNNVGATINTTATAYTMVAGAAITNTGGTINATTCTFALSGNPSSVTNQNSGGTTGLFRGIACAFTFSGTNSINNSGTFMLYGGSSVVMNGTSLSSSVANTGTFYAGTSNSACTITLNGAGSLTNTNNPSTFYLGSTSVINYFNTSSANCSITNNTGAFFILQSDAFGSATIGSIPQGLSNNLTGTFYVQRFITGGAGYRGYRIFSSPVNAGTVNTNKVVSLNYLQTSIFVLGTTGTAGGFDKTGNPTIYLFRENLTPQKTTFLNSNWQGISNILSAPTYGTNDVIAANQSINVPVGNGYLVFFRGDRTAITPAALALSTETTSGYVPTSTIVTAIGTMNSGPVTVKDWYTPTLSTLGYTAASPAASRGYNCVGNPYPSSIDWDTFSSTVTTAGIYGPNVSKTIAVLNANGSYGIYTAGSGGVGATNYATHIIPSGVGFLVLAGAGSAPSPALNFTENAKVNTQVTGLNLLMGKPPKEGPVAQYLRLEMAKDSFSNENIVISFNPAASSAYVFDEDAPYKLGNCKVNLNSISRDNIPLAINSIPLPHNSESIKLNIGAQEDGSYSLNLKELVSIPVLYDLWLVDLYKKDSLDLRINPSYRFQITKSDTGSFGSERLRLVIRQNPALFYKLLDFQATKSQGRQVQLTWKTQNEENYTYFTVERSIDGGNTFNVVGGPASTGAGEYSLTDKYPGEQNLYRLKQIDVNNNISYSKLIPIGYADPAGSLSKGNLNVYPNPATSEINLSISDAIGSSHSYNIHIINSAGAIMKQASTASQNWQTGVAQLLPGAYVIKVVDTKNNTFIGDAKFIKQ